MGWMLSVMRFFLEYEAEGTVVGRVLIPRGSREEAFLYAKEALRGMDCLRAVLRCSETPMGLSGAYGTIARYTRSTGWQPKGW